MKLNRLTILPVIIVFLLVLFSCKKETEYITNTVTDTVGVRAVDTTFIMTTQNWHMFSYATLNLTDTGSTTYSTTPEGVRFAGQAFRLGARIQTKSEVGFEKKYVYFRWKVNGNGLFAAFVPQLKYDPLSNDGVPPIMGVDFALFTVNGTFGGSTQVNDNTWYYTRLAPITGTNNFQITTSTGNYSNLGGTIIHSTTMPIYTKSGYLALRMGDNYAATNAYGIVGEVRIASN